MLLHGIANLPRPNVDQVGLHLGDETRDPLVENSRPILANRSLELELRVVRQHEAPADAVCHERACDQHMSLHSRRRKVR